MKPILIILSAVLFSCASQHKPTLGDIHRLEPITSIVDFKDNNGNFRSRSVIDYYVIYGDVTDKVYIEKRLLSFASTHFDSSKIISPVYYELRFYKKSKRTNKEFKEKPKDLIDFHADDYLANVTYSEHGEHWLHFY